MAKKPSYRQLSINNIYETPEWTAYARGERSIPQEPEMAGGLAICFYYLGDEERGKEASYLYSVYCAESAETVPYDFTKVLYLFDAALYRSLAQRPSEARALWQYLVNTRQGRLSEEELLKLRKAHLWIYEAYALAKLERYNDVTEPAGKGFDGICRGKGVFKAPHQNSKEYGLAHVLQALAAYKLNPTPEGQRDAQKALIAYKKENLRYGRIGYPVIFDLQLSYSDVFTPVLPGPDPEGD